MTDDDLADLGDLYVDLVRRGKLTREERHKAKAELEIRGLRGDKCRIFMSLVNLAQRELEVVEVEKNGLKRELNTAFRVFEASKSNPPITSLTVDISTEVRAALAATAKGENRMGDEIKIGGSVQNAAIGSAAQFKAGDIHAFQQTIESTAIPEDDKTVLKRAAEVLVAAGLLPGDEEDIKDDLGKLAAEMEKPERDDDRISKILKRIKEGAATVAAMLATAVSLKKYFEGQ